jgi:hypothetical protein
MQKHYDSIFSIVKAGAVVLERPRAAVHKDKRIQETRKINASQAVKRFNTSAVDVPNKDSLASPPNEAPKPELLLSCIKITAHNKIHKIMKRAIVKK